MTGSRSLRFSILLATAASIASTAIEFAVISVARVATACTYAIGWLADVVFEPLRAAMKRMRTWLAFGPAPEVSAGRQYVAHQMKRERPRVFSTWRMCPST